MASSSDGIPVLPPMPDFSEHSNTPFSSAGDMKFHLQTLLDSKEKQLQQAGTLGQRVLAQQMELEERIKQLQEIEAEKSEDDEIDEQARVRYRELADTLISWDTENAQLSSAFGSSKRFVNGNAPSPSVAFTELPREEPERSKNSAGTSAAQSRRAKNAAHRADDVEFAFEIGSGLLTEVRRLQSLLGERDKAIQDMKEEKDDLEKSVESLRTALREQEQSADKYKEENWNLEVTLQELRTQLGDSQASTQRLETEHKRLTKLLAASRDSGDHHKNESERLQNLVQEMKAKHETDIAHARKHAAGLARDKSDLQQTVDTLKTEVVRAGRRFPRFGSPYTPNGTGAKDFLTPAGGDEMDGDVFTGGASTNRRKIDASAIYGTADQELGSDYADSPDVSPVRPPFLAANHPSNEIEALQQRLAHAQRQINTLKGTLHREKQLRMDYKHRLEASPGGLPAGMAHEEDDEDGGYEDEDTTMEGKKTGKVRSTTPFKVGGRGAGAFGHGRGRGGRGGITLIQRLGMAAHSPSSEFNDDDQSHLDDSPPPVPPIPIRFSQAEGDEEELFTSSKTMREEELLQGEDENEPRDRVSRSPSPLEPPSNRTSVDGMDPVFANVLRRVPSNGSTYAGSPLRQSVLGGSARGRGRAVGIGRRSRGGVPYKETRPPSLVDSAPDVLSAELLGMDSSGSPMKGQDTTLEEIEEHTDMHKEVETAEFACQTEVVEEEVQVKVEDTPVPDVRVTVEMGVQADPEPEREPEPVVVVSPPPAITVSQSMQTEDEVIVVIERSEIGIQHVHEEPAPVHSEMNVGTDPEPQPEPVAAPVMVQTEMQTIPPEKVDVDTQTSLVKPEIRALGVGVGAEKSNRRTTITQYDMSRSISSGNSPITQTAGRNFLAEREVAEDEDEDGDDGDETETGADSETEPESDLDDYLDARSIMMTTPGTESRDEFHSVMTMTDNDFSESDDEDDGESIKVSEILLHYRGQASAASSVRSGSRPSSYYAVDALPTVEYEDVGVSADFKLEPERIIIEVPLPKPEVKEISIQTDEWKPLLPPVFVPAPPATPPSPSQLSPGLYRVGSMASQQFQFVAPLTPTGSSSSAHVNGSVPIQPAAPGPLSNVLRVSTSDRRQSIESAISSAEDFSSRPRVASTGTMLSVVDKSKPPMMAVPPPPRLPPPPSAMAPPAFIPERRIPLNSTGSYDLPPPRPSSPPPAELIQRATTPTFGAVLSVPGAKGLYNFRQSGSSMPPSQAGLRQPPSTSSFRSAANAAAYAQHSVSPGGALSAFNAKEREKRQFSSTSLISERSIASPRSSMSSDHNPYRSPAMPEPVTPEKSADITPRANVNVTDPAVIHAITQTMIGEFMYKYTRRAIGKGHGERRHKRFFWVHPYTRTLYWSSADPGSSNVSESSAKSAYVDGVRSVLDPNPMPPGLYQYSVIVSTPQREMKFTAPTKERHDIWFNALKYLLSRPNNMNITSPGDSTIIPQSPASLGDFTDDDHRPPIASSPQSQRSGRSVRQVNTWNTTPRGQRSRSQVSIGRGSIGKRTGTPAAEYLRWNGPDSPYSPSKSFVDLRNHDGEDLEFELHDHSLSDDGFEGLENVRACCDGRHTVGHSGKPHFHHPHHHHHPTDHRHNGDHHHLEPGPHREPLPVRPVSPSAWSFRSRTGSSNSHDGGGGGIFSWGRGEDGKLRFGSRRSTKTVPTHDQ